MREIKTIKVEELKKYINDLLSNERISQEDKKAYCGVIEHFLHSTNNYCGFKYIYWANRGYKEWKEAGEPGFPEKQKYIGSEHDRYYY